MRHLSEYSFRTGVNAVEFPGVLAAQRRSRLCVMAGASAPHLVPTVPGLLYSLECPSLPRLAVMTGSKNEQLTSWLRSVLPEVSAAMLFVRTKAHEGHAVGSRV